MRFPCLLILLLTVSGCGSERVTEVAGQRTNSQGEITEKITRVEKIVTHTALLTPEGPRHYSTITCRYYFQENGKPEQEFLIGNSRTNNLLGQFLAISNSPLWVTFSETIIWTNRSEAAHIVTPEWVKPPQSRTSYQVNDLDIYVFDQKGFFRHRTFMALQKGEEKFVPEGQTYAAVYTFENGNRIVAFKSPKGLKKYDVLNDTVTDVVTK